MAVQHGMGGTWAGMWGRERWGHGDALTWGHRRWGYGDMGGTDMGTWGWTHRGTWEHSGTGHRGTGHGDTAGTNRDVEGPWPNQSRPWQLQEGTGVPPAPVPPPAAVAASPALPSAPSIWRTWSGRLRDPSPNPAVPLAPGPQCPRTGCPDPGTPPSLDTWVPLGCGICQDPWVPTLAVLQAGLLRWDGTGRRCCHLRGLPRRDVGLRQGAPAAARCCGTRWRAAPLHPHRHQVCPGGGTGWP